MRHFVRRIFGRSTPSTGFVSISSSRFALFITS
jgi:hypothetical protein